MHIYSMYPFILLLQSLLLQYVLSITTLNSRDLSDINFFSDSFKNIYDKDFYKCSWGIEKNSNFKNGFPTKDYFTCKSFISTASCKCDFLKTLRENCTIKENDWYLSDLIEMTCKEAELEEKTETSKIDKDKKKFHQFLKQEIALQNNEVKFIEINKRSQSNLRKINSPSEEFEWDSYEDSKKFKDEDCINMTHQPAKRDELNYQELKTNFDKSNRFSNVKDYNHHLNVKKFKEAKMDKDKNVEFITIYGATKTREYTTTKSTTTSVSTTFTTSYTRYIKTQTKTITTSFAGGNFQINNQFQTSIPMTTIAKKTVYVPLSITQTQTEISTTTITANKEGQFLKKIIPFNSKIAKITAKNDNINDNNTNDKKIVKTHHGNDQNNNNNNNIVNFYHDDVLLPKLNKEGKGETPILVINSSGSIKLKPSLPLWGTAMVMLGVLFIGYSLVHDYAVVTNVETNVKKENKHNNDSPNNTNADEEYFDCCEDQTDG